jgi:predicted peptidase
VVEYTVDLTGAVLQASDFEVGTYATRNPNRLEVGENPGAVLNAYVNDQPDTSTEGGSGTGNYVILELNTDYQLNNGAYYNEGMAVDVLQTAAIMTDRYTILPGTEKVVNYESQEYTSSKGTTSIKNYVLDDAYTLLGTEVFDIHTIDGTGDLAPFYATHCFDESTGEYSDVTVPYSIYVPDDYDPSKKYALAVHIGAAGCASNDPLITLSISPSAINLASDEVQQMVKDQGLGGMIVVCPQVPEGLRSTRDNWTTSAAVSAHWQLLDQITQTYNIDQNRIYGTGHSMGGMQLLEMAAQRDNYFAALWPIGCQWGNNYNKEVEYQDKVYYPTPADGTLIWTQDADGNPCDYQNWFYMVSDDNILITNCAGDAFSTGTWQELSYLYSDLCGITFPKAQWNPLTTSIEDQNTMVRQLVSQESGNGFYWFAFDGGSHNATWIYAHSLSAGYEWLVSQTRETEMSREKLDLDKPFAFADEQLTTEDRVLWTDSSDPSNVIYYATGKSGSGTSDYNSPVYVNSGTPAKKPGWTAAD